MSETAAIRTAPIRVRTAEPLPPVIAVPPARTAAIASKVRVPPVLTLAEVLNAPLNAAATAISAPAPSQASEMVRPTGSPAARAAGRFSPVR